MSAELAHPHWAYVWPAYAATAACFLALAGWTLWRLAKWARAADAAERL